jgi:hypothetical protein
MEMGNTRQRFKIPLADSGAAPSLGAGFLMRMIYQTMLACLACWVWASPCPGVPLPAVPAGPPVFRTATSLAREVDLETPVGNIAEDSAVSLDGRAAPPGGSLRFALLTIGALALLALLGIGLGAVVRTRSMAANRSFGFPGVDQPQRLGAPSGGQAVSRSFRQKD